jgi:hypothetical protein
MYIYIFFFLNLNSIEFLITIGETLGSIIKYNVRVNSIYIFRQIMASSGVTVDLYLLVSTPKTFEINNFFKFLERKI